MPNLCLYTFHEYTNSVDYFIDYGIPNAGDVDIYIIINNPKINLTIPGVTILKRENINMDFGAFSFALLSPGKKNKYLYQDYDKFIFVNSSVIGPFLPVWAKGIKWTDILLNGITDSVKLFGPHINIYNGRFHVQSFVYATDRIGLDLLVKNKIYTLEDPALNYGQVVACKEVKQSDVILAAGYNIGCLLKQYEGIDFRDPKTLKIFRNQTNCDYTVVPAVSAANHLPPHPPELLFIKYKPGNTMYHSLGPHLYSKWTRLKDKIPTTGLFYMVDLTRYTSFIDQITILVDAIIKGIADQRDVIVYDFHLGQGKTIRIGKIIDIDKLNNLIGSIKVFDNYIPFPNQVSTINSYSNDLSPNKKSLIKAMPFTDDITKQDYLFSPVINEIKEFITITKTGKYLPTGIQNLDKVFKE